MWSDVASVKGNIIMMPKKSMIPLIILGLLLIGGWLEIVSIDVQATQAFVNNGVALPADNNAVSVFAEMWYLFVGDLPVHDRMLIIAGWGTELIYMVGVIGWEICKSAVGFHNPSLAKWFGRAAIVMVVVNLWTTGNFGTFGAAGFWGHFYFAVLTAFGSAFFGLIGVYLLEFGFSNGTKTPPTQATQAKG